jgi:L-fuconolactonase
MTHLIIDDQPRAGEALPVVDTHYHVWEYQPDDFEWMVPDYLSLQRSFSPADYAVEVAANQVQAAIVMQARQLPEENQYLADVMAQASIPNYAVAWFDLLSGDAPALIESSASDPRIVSARYFLVFQPDDAIFADPRFRESLRALAACNLRYDLLVRADQLAACIDLVAAMPNLTFVLNHGGNPLIDGPDLGWRDNIKVLGEAPNVYVKVSGLTDNVQAATVTADAFDPYLDQMVSSFGPERLIFGSNWPVVNNDTTFAAYRRLIVDFFERQFPEALPGVLSHNAVSAYGLKGLPNI